MPHSEKRFVGYSKEDKKLDSEMLRKYILGGHISEYMESMQEDEPEKYEKHFARFIKAGLEPGTLADTYKKVQYLMDKAPASGSFPSHDQPSMLRDSLVVSCPASKTLQDKLNHGQEMVWVGAATL